MLLDVAIERSADVIIRNMAEQFCFHRSRSDQAYPDAMIGLFFAKSFAECANGRLGGRIDGRMFHHPIGRRGDHVHDQPFSLFPHGRQYGRHRMEHALDVGIDHRFPLFDLSLPHRRQQHHTGAVHQDVDASKTMQPCFCHVFQLICLPDIRLHCQHVCSLCFQFTAKLPHPLFSASAQDEPGPFLCKLTGTGFTDPARCPCQKDDLSLQRSAQITSPLVSITF